MKLYTLKTLSAISGFFGRIFIYNRNAPDVDRFLKSVSYGDHWKQRMDIVPGKAGDALPMVIHFHGGGWVSGTKNNYHRLIKEIAVHGYVTASVNYRLAPGSRFPEQEADVAASIRYLVDNAHAFGADAGRVFLMGDSAGAHLASWYAAALNKPELSDTIGFTRDDLLPGNSLVGVILFYGVYDFTMLFREGNRYIRGMARRFLGPDDEARRRNRETASTLRHLTPRFFPTLVVCGEADYLYHQSVALDQALAQGESPHQSLFFDRKTFRGARHGFLNIPYRRVRRIALREVIDFLRKYSSRSSD